MTYANATSLRRMSTSHNGHILFGVSLALYLDLVDLISRAERDSQMRSNYAFEPPGWRLIRRAVGALRKSAPAARSYCRFAAAQRER